MGRKRKAQEAFTGKTGHLSAIAAAKLARQSSQSSTEAPQDPAHLAATIAANPYDAPQSTLATAPEAEDDSETPAASAPPAKLAIQLSTFRDPEQSIARDDAQGIELRLALNDTATLIGEYDVQVLNGVATVYGMVLRPRAPICRVYAPSTHPLPSIQSRQDGTVVRISGERSTVRKLDALSPLFRNVWAADGDAGRAFTLLRSSSDDVLQRSLGVLEVGREMQGVLRALSAKMESPTTPPPRVMTVGAKSAGKSIFNRVLCNHWLSWTSTSRCQYLDLDPGQPEFGPPGQLSLVEISAPLLGPPLTHLATAWSKAFRTVRSHTIAATSFREDPELYKDIARDLVRRVNGQYPVVINTCGWVNGLGAAMLEELVGILCPTDIVQFDPLDPSLVDGLAQQSDGADTHHLPRQYPKPAARTPAESRTMLTMAYFHQRSTRGDDPGHFSGKPISKVRPWIIPFAHTDAAIQGLMSYGPSPGPDFFCEVLDGSLVALVVLQDRSAISTPDPPDVVSGGLPVFLPPADGTSRTVDPRRSRCVGLALVRAIDLSCQELQLVTPLPDEEVMAWSEKDVVLVRGGFDAAGWAYLEDLYNGRDRSEGSGAADGGQPWVSRRQMTGIESAVWRLRHPPGVSHNGGGT